MAPALMRRAAAGALSRREANKEGIKFNNLNLWGLFLTLLTGGLIWRLLADGYGEC